jgi:hypothetical protein
MTYNGMDPVFISYLTGLFGLFYLHHFPEESDKTQSASLNQQ